MRSPAPHRLRRRPCWLAAAAGCLSPVVASCAAGPPLAHLPAKPATAGVRAVAASTRRPLSRRGLVIAAYEGFTAADIAATDSGSAARARALLAPYMSKSADASLVSALVANVWRKHETGYGSPRTTILGVTITGAKAVVHSCEDATGTGLKNTITGQPVPGTEGQPQTNEFTEFLWSGGRWLYQRTTILDAPCGTRP